MRYVYAFLALLVAIVAAAIYPLLLWDNPVLTLGDVFPSDVAMLLALFIFAMVFVALAPAAFAQLEQPAEIVRAEEPFLGEVWPRLTGTVPAVRLGGQSLLGKSTVRQNAVSRDFPMLGHPAPAE